MNKEKNKGRAEAPAKEESVGFGKLMAWTLRGGSVGICMMIMGYLSLFCTDTLGIAPAYVGTLLLLSKLLDGITDLAAGFIVDRTNTRWGKGRPFEWCVVGLWLATLLMYMTPEQFSMQAKLVWIFVMYALANSVFNTFLNANGTVYMVRAFSSQKQYVALSTYGGVVPMVMTLAFNIVFPIMMGTLATSQKGWIQLVLIFMIPLVLLGMLRFFFIKEVNDVDVKSHGEKIRFRDVLAVLKKNPYIYIIAASSLVMNLITNMGVQVYYFKQIVGSVGLMSVLAATQVVILPLMFILPQILKRTTTVNVIKVGLLITAAGWALNFVAGSNLPLLVVASLMTGGGVVPMSMLSGLLIIECAEYNEYSGIRRMEGTLSSVNGFAAKIGAGVGAGLLGILIGMAGYDGDLAVQPDSAILMIRMLYSLIPAALYVVVFILFNMYTIGKRMPEIRRTNEERRATIAAEADGNQ